MKRNKYVFLIYILIYVVPKKYTYIFIYCKQKSTKLGALGNAA